MGRTIKTVRVRIGTVPENAETGGLLGSRAGAQDADGE